MKWYGFRHFRNLKYGEMFTQDAQVFEEWKAFFRKYTILTEFHEIYEVVDYLGKGASARVFQGLHLLSKKHYAIKAFHK